MSFFTSCWFEIVERIISLSHTVGRFILTLVAAKISQRRIWVLNITESWVFYVLFCTDILHQTPVSSLSLNHFAHMQFEKCLFVFPCMRGSMNFMRAQQSSEMTIFTWFSAAANWCMLGKKPKKQAFNFFCDWIKLYCSTNGTFSVATSPCGNDWK